MANLLRGLDAGMGNESGTFGQGDFLGPVDDSTKLDELANISDTELDAVMNENVIRSTKTPRELAEVLTLQNNLMFEKETRRMRSVQTIIIGSCFLCMFVQLVLFVFAILYLADVIGSIKILALLQAITWIICCALVGAAHLYFYIIIFYNEQKYPSQYGRFKEFLKRPLYLSNPQIFLSYGHIYDKRDIRNTVDYYSMLSLLVVCTLVCTTLAFRIMVVSDRQIDASYFILETGKVDTHSSPGKGLPPMIYDSEDMNIVYNHLLETFIENLEMSTNDTFEYNETLNNYIGVGTNLSSSSFTSPSENITAFLLGTTVPIHQDVFHILTKWYQTSETFFFNVAIIVTQLMWLWVTLHTLHLFRRIAIPPPIEFFLLWEKN